MKKEVKNTENGMAGFSTHTMLLDEFFGRWTA